MTEDACRVLVVDDEAQIRILLADYLAEDGYEIRWAADGQEALAVLSRWRPDLILLDLMMPVMDGWTFRAAQLRIPELAAIPVLIFSACFNPEAQVEVLKASGALPKGSDLDELVRAIRRVVAAV